MLFKNIEILLLVILIRMNCYNLYTLTKHWFPYVYCVPPEIKWTNPGSR